MGSGVIEGDVTEQVTELDENQTEAEQGSGFDFSHAEQLLGGDGDERQTESGSGKAAIEGEYLSADEMAKNQAKAVVGLMDMSFKFAGNQPYKDSDYAEGQKHLAPAIVRLNFRIPAFEVLNAVIWLGGRLMQSMRELKNIKRKQAEDAEQAHKQTQQ